MRMQTAMFGIRSVSLHDAGVFAKGRRHLGLAASLKVGGRRTQSACNDCHSHPSFAPGGDPHQGQSEVINAEEYRLPKFVRALRGFLSLVVTKVHVR